MSGGAPSQWASVCGSQPINTIEFNKAVFANDAEVNIYNDNIDFRLNLAIGCFKAE